MSRCAFGYGEEFSPRALVVVLVVLEIAVAGGVLLNARALGTDGAVYDLTLGMTQTCSCPAFIKKTQGRWFTTVTHPLGAASRRRSGSRSGGVK